MNGHIARAPASSQEEDLMQLTLQLRNKNVEGKNAKFHGDDLIGDPTSPHLKKLKKEGLDKKGIYSENEIYQHITNCQMFLTYDADESKWMARRRAFRASMQTLIDLTQNGTIGDANQWDLTRALFGKQ
ncbi:heme peroxidase-domain-containing protein [Apiospora saccharicola]|uniref:Heme peroxidase-domain-containing protein n=1 Tax=Apiospora saccharicola TaxID=335842 RepID=A0ABR1UJG2_9PEZI